MTTYQPGQVVAETAEPPPYPPDLIPGREAVAHWMMIHGYATGHGDTIEDMLIELVGQVESSPATKGK